MLSVHKSKVELNFKAIFIGVRFFIFLIFCKPISIFYSVLMKDENSYHENHCKTYVNYLQQCKNYNFQYKLYYNSQYMKSVPLEHKISIIIKQ